MLENTKHLCDGFLKNGVPGFDLCIYKDGKCVLRHMGGYSDLENKIPMNGKERYNIYSCSKLITCVAAMQLWEKGLFSLGDRLSDYIPEFSEMTVKTENGIKKAEEPILIEQLFGMSAGFSYDCYSPSIKSCIERTNGKAPTVEAVKALAKEPLLFEPGQRWEYSLCHDVLAALVEVISGKSFNAYVTENIFKPLGMASSSFIISPKEREALACQYSFNDEQGKAVNVGKGNWYIVGSEYASGGAGCASTVEDYMKLMEALRVGDIILKKETVALMATDRLTGSQRKTYWSQGEYGFGLGVRCKKKNGTLGDFGWGGAAGAHYAIDIENGISLYLAMHLLSSPVQEYRGRAYDMALAELTGKGDIKQIFAKCKYGGEYDYTF